MLVATVDHGLREESRAEAADVGEAAARLGLRHRILGWLGPKPVTRIQERARDMRYQLLAEAAREFGATGIVTGHHADDQAETVLMRLAKGSGLSGLAGMRARSRREGLDHWRPLLGAPKAALIDYCGQVGQTYVDDPSNSDRRYLRAGLRESAADLERMGLGRDNLVRLAARAARADEALEQAARAFLAHWDGGDAKALAALPDEIALRVLACAINRVPRKPSALRLERLERLWLRLRAAIETGEPFAATLAGAAARLDRKGRLDWRPEPPRRPDAPN